MKEDLKKALNTIGDSANIIIEPAKQRMSNPIIGSFVITFFALNWKPIVFLLLSSKTIEEKLDYFKVEFYGEKWWGLNSYCMYLVFPLLITIIYIVIIPIAIEWIDKKLQYTKVNRLRRENIINYKKHRGQESIAWAQFKTEEARTGFEDRNKLTKDLEKFKNELAAEKEDAKKLTETFLKQTADFTDIKNRNKELTIERDSYKRESENLSKTNLSNDNIINDLNTSIVEKNNSIENLNSQIQQYSNEILQKNQIINDLNIRIGEVNNSNSSLDAQLAHQTNEIDRLFNEVNNLNTSNHQLTYSKLDLENQLNNLNNEFNSMNQRLSNYNELETNFHYLNQIYLEIQNKIDLPEKQDFQNTSGISDFIHKSINFITSINNMDLMSFRPKIFYILQMVRLNDLALDSFLNEFFNISQGYGLTVVKMSFMASNHMEVIVSTTNEHQISEFTNNSQHLMEPSTLLVNRY